ncbi:hypothetical protein STRTUCAR8_02820 [Streptomyces turgidiscabies Car8]|uniref:Uncharacterized protein n=1 Tax=Streptomyces turgidiscabies (strain Car8) TaxID=698760 RepID=L7ET68_STRT8|nr:hypothetical protein STRTUCAR8_02820 [Streptomyces turgidiscabies Car8]
MRPVPGQQTDAETEREGSSVENRLWGGRHERARTGVRARGAGPSVTIAE